MVNTLETSSKTSQASAAGASVRLPGDPAGAVPTSSVSPERRFLFSFRHSQPGPLPGICVSTAALLVVAAFLTGCRTNVYIMGLDPAPEKITVLNGVFWRSAGGEGTGAVSNAISGGGSPQVKVSAK